MQLKLRQTPCAKRPELPHTRHLTLSRPRSFPSWPGCFEADDSFAEALRLYKEIEPLYSNPEAIQIKIRALETRILKKSY